MMILVSEMNQIQMLITYPPMNNQIDEILSRWRYYVPIWIGRLTLTYLRNQSIGIGHWVCKSKSVSYKKILIYFPK